MVINTLQYRFARPEEIPAVARMVAHSFPGAARSREWWHEQLADPVYGGGHDTLLTGWKDDRVVAALQLHPVRQWIGGKLLPVAAVGTVSIAPTHRKQGLAADLMTAALRAAHDRGDVGSSLYPFRSSFYQKLGYGQSGEALQYQIAPSLLPDSDERMSVELIDTDEGRAEVLSYYGAWAREQTGQLERTTRLWTHLADAADHALVGYRPSPGAPLEGYALVAYRPDLPRAERYIEVEELVWTTPGARRGLYGWLASLADQWDRVVIRALPSHRLGDWIREVRLPVLGVPLWGLWRPGAALMMGTMFRLVNAEAAFEDRPAAGSVSVGLEVVDDQLSSNAGSWRLLCDGGRASLTRTGASSVDATLRLDVSTLSRLFVSSLKATDALTAGLLECDNASVLPQLDAALALPEPWTFDRF
ncbi:MAG: GNAT family N-acetyltransferase [Longimicrobiales bacterium]